MKISHEDWHVASDRVTMQLYAATQDDTSLQDHLEAQGIDAAGATCVAKELAEKETTMPAPARLEVRLAIVALIGIAIGVEAQREASVKAGL